MWSVLIWIEGGNVCSLCLDKLPHLAVLLRYGTYLAREEHVTHGSNRKFRTHFISFTFRTQSAPQDIQWRRYLKTELLFSCWWRCGATQEERGRRRQGKTRQDKTSALNAKVIKLLNRSILCVMFLAAEYGGPGGRTSVFHDDCITSKIIVSYENRSLMFTAVFISAASQDTIRRLIENCFAVEGTTEEIRNHCATSHTFNENFLFFWIFSVRFLFSIHCEF